MSPFSLLRALLTNSEKSISSKTEEKSLSHFSVANGENLHTSFNSYIGSQIFRKFEDFKSRLPDFYSLNNVRYKVVRCTPLPTTNSKKSTLIHRYMKYACCIPDCPSYFVLSKKRDHLRISQFNMYHNHQLLPENCKAFFY